MPLRQATVPTGPSQRLYRRLGFGDLVSMHVLDTRQYRDDQPCGGGMTAICADWSDPRRTLLGAEQERWLLAGLAEPTARWNVIAQQTMVATMARRDARGDEVHWMDAWDGYPAQRRRLLDALASERVRNPVVLTGDIHSSWVADLHADPDAPVVGTELVGTSISSTGDGHESNAEAEQILRLNPHLRFYNGRRGYVRCDVRPDLLTTHFRAVPFVTRPDAPLETKATWVVEAGRPGATA